MGWQFHIYVGSLALWPRCIKICMKTVSWRRNRCRWYERHSDFIKTADHTSWSSNWSSIFASQDVDFLWWATVLIRIVTLAKHIFQYIPVRFGLATLHFATKQCTVDRTKHNWCCKYFVLLKLHSVARNDVETPSLTVNVHAVVDIQESIETRKIEVMSTFLRLKYSLRDALLHRFIVYALCRNMYGMRSFPFTPFRWDSRGRQQWGFW